MPDLSEDLKIILKKEESYIKQIKDFENYWYLGERFQFNSYAGYTNAPYKSETLNFSKQGFRGGEKTFKKVNKNKRVAIFGPSGLVGIPVAKDNETITFFANEFFKKNSIDIDVLDFGVICSRIGIEDRLITKTLNEYDVDIVVLMSGFNDFSSFTIGSMWEYQDIQDIYEAGFEFNKNSTKPMYFFKRLIKSLKRKFEIRRAEKLSIKTFRGAEKFFRAKRAKIIDNVSFPDVLEEGLELYFSTISKIISLCEFKKKKFIFLPQPTLFNTNKSLSIYEEASFRRQNNFFGQDEDLNNIRINKFKNYYDDFRTKAKKEIEDSKSIFLDADLEISKISKSEDIFYDESHYFEKGNKIIGELISKYIAKNFL